MQGVFTIAIFFLLASCGGNPDWREGHGSLGHMESLDARPKDKAGGLTFTLENKISNHTPEVALFICAGKYDSKNKDSRSCFSAPSSTVSYGTSKIFHVTKEQTKQLLDKGQSQVWVGFNDSYSKSLAHWHCYEYPDTKIEQDIDKTQYFDVEVSQINIASYSCSIK